MHEDNAYSRPASSYISQSNLMQIEEQKKEEIEINSQIELIRELISSIKSQIEFLGNIDSLTFSVLEEPEKHMHQTVAHQIAKKTLERELSKIIAVVRQYKGGEHIQ